MGVRYSNFEKDLMRLAHADGKSTKEIATHFGCAPSTVFYAVNRRAYEKHKMHVYFMRHLKKGGSSL